MTPPEELLAAARKAYPEYEWTIEHFTSGPVCHRYGSPRLIFFDLEKHLADQMALQIALEKDGWTFNAAKLNKDEYIFIASKPGHLLNEKTKPDLLLAIVREGV